LPHRTPGATDSQARQARYAATLPSFFARHLRVVFYEPILLVETLLNLAAMAPLDDRFSIFF
jgi:hypothetical protein